MVNLLRRGRVLLLLVLAVALALPGAVAAQTQDPGPNDERSRLRSAQDEKAVPGEIIVKYKENVGSAAQAAIRRQEGLEKKQELALIHAELVKARGQSVGQAIRGLEARPEVEYAEPNFIYQPTGYADEPQFAQLWGLHNTGQTIGGSPGTPNVDINGKEASARTQGSTTLKVAVIDDGVDFSHPDLAARAWKNPGESGSGKETDGIDNDGNGKVDDVNGWDFVSDDNTVHDADDAHGTHVSGTIAASVNNQGIVGVAPNVKIMALKFLGPEGGSTSDAILAIQYAKSKGAKISNNSWSGGSFSQALKDAIDQSGSLFVAAAGNGGSDGIGDDNDSVPHYPSSYTSTNILAVAAANNQGSLAGFSNFGKTSVDISAPGVDILSSVPGVPANPAAALSSVGTSGGKALTAGFGADEIGDATKRASFFTKAFQAVGRGTQQVVLVDDDLSEFSSFYPDVAPSLSTAIQSATGSAPTQIDAGDGDGPALSQLSGKTVVWATGQACDSDDSTCWGFGGSSTTLTANDQATLSSFLNGGGKLVLTGMDALFLIENSSFVTSTLGLDVFSDINFMTGAPAGTFTGSAGTAYAGEFYALNSTTANESFHDKVAPAGASAATQGVYPGSPASWESWDGTSMATPHVSGVAALVASKYPTLLSQPKAIKKIIMDTGKPLAATAGKTVTGDMANAQAALFPRVTTTSPTYGKTGVARGTNVTATFSEAMNATTVNGTTFTLVKDGTTTKISATVTYDATTKKATLNPSASLAANTVYKATVKGGSTGVKNTLGDPMFTSKVWKFTTGAS